MQTARTVLLTLAVILTAAAAIAGEELRANPALPSPTDLVTFDDAPEETTAVDLAALDKDGANQGVFPAFYGTIPPIYEPLAPPETPASPAPAEPETALAAPAPEQKPEAPPEALIETPAAPPAPADLQTAAVETTPTASTAPALPAPEPMAAPATPELLIDINQVRADFAGVKKFTDENSLGSAAEVYARMPDFGANEEANRLRADAANLLVLGLSRADDLSAARRIYESVPVDMPGEEATLAKARSIVNLATYYVRAERYSDAYDILMDIGKIRNRSTLNTELFRLMARMIPYLDNADQTDKAAAVYDLLLGEVASPGTAALFAENVPGVFKYYLHYVDKSESPRNRRKRLDFLEHAFQSMEKFPDNPDIRLARRNLGESLAARYAGDPERAAQFYVEE